MPPLRSPVDLSRCAALKLPLIELFSLIGGVAVAGARPRAAAAAAASTVCAVASGGHEGVLASDAARTTCRSGDVVHHVEIDVVDRIGFGWLEGERMW